jgi:SAM-dependent methyltransferase
MMTVSAEEQRQYDARLRRGRRLWNLLAGITPGFGERLNDPVRSIALRELHLRPGDAVLDIGCGAGSFFPGLREAVGPDGRVVGIDNSPGMLRRARNLVAAKGWDNVTVLAADAGRDRLGDNDFDAAVAVSSLSATADVRAAASNAFAALRPGGRLFVFDIRLVPTSGARLLVRALHLMYRALAGATGEDVLAELRLTFGSVEVLRGSRELIVVAIAEKPSSPH